MATQVTEVVAIENGQGEIPYHNVSDQVVPMEEDEDVLHDEHDAGNQVVPMEQDEGNQGVESPERQLAEEKLPNPPVKPKQIRVSRKLNFE